MRIASQQKIDLLKFARIVKDSSQITDEELGSGPIDLVGRA